MQKKKYGVYYNPEPFNPRGEYMLHETDDKDEAIAAAVGNSKLWGPTWVMDGKKKIFKHTSSSPLL